jgi:hypothetical protein
MDENQYHITEDFINRSWNNMRMKLDQEIPVHRRRPWWLFFLAMSIFVALYGYLAWQGFQAEDASSEKTIQQLKESESPVESTDFVIQQSSANLEETSAYVSNEGNNATEILFDAATITSLKNIAGSKVQEPGLIRRAELVKGHINQKSHIDQKNHLALTDSKAGNERGIDLLIKTDALKDEFTDSEILDVSEFKHLSEMPGLNNRPLLSFAVLPLLQFSMFELNFLDLLPFPSMSLTGNTEVLKIESPQSNFGFGVYTSVLSNELFSASGFDFGASSYWQIRDSWRISASIGYQQFQYKTTEDELLDAASELEPNMDTTAFSSAIMLDYGSANNLIRKTSHLHTQLGLSYKLRRSLWLTGAFRVSKLLKATNKELFISSSALEQNQLNIGASYLKDNGITDNWDLGLLVGIEWHLHRNIALAAQYHYGLDPILRKESLALRGANAANENTQYQRFVRLGLNVYFR